ncbi:hypothetical protein GCM10011591_32510 [Nocardia camponoti]|uniref:Uncharacterized protein n=1 Tax=Nocardia camponoti TaxID=1616106 RepID=A0A917QM83_9NOCA|nr:hypothetical protein GCM10011591_32510 [Nocardia camponoti]
MLATVGERTKGGKENVAPPVRVTGKAVRDCARAAAVRASKARTRLTSSAS